jgi:hypothetical protein
MEKLIKGRIEASLELLDALSLERMEVMSRMETARISVVTKRKLEEGELKLDDYRDIIQQMENDYKYIHLLDLNANHVLSGVQELANLVNLLGKNLSDIGFNDTEIVKIESIRKSKIGVFSQEGGKVKIAETDLFESIFSQKISDENLKVALEAIPNE